MEQLRSNVKTQESKLEKGMRQLDRAKEKSKKRKARGGFEDFTLEWNALEMVVEAMEDLLSRYRRYTSELEKQNAKLSVSSTAKVKKKA